MTRRAFGAAVGGTRDWLILGGVVAAARVRVSYEGSGSREQSNGPKRGERRKVVQIMHHSTQSIYRII
ncbi:hypothetical protein RSAG8_12054, partial [Rhizoctonia solani AG-8 WAC10335]